MKYFFLLQVETNSGGVSLWTNSAGWIFKFFLGKLQYRLFRLTFLNIPEYPVCCCCCCCYTFLELGVSLRSMTIKSNM